MLNPQKRRLRRSILGGRRMTGTILSWRGTVGWIKPSTAINHPEAVHHQGRVFVHASDFGAGVNMGRLRGARVNFTVYADGSGLGAQQCRVVTLGDASAPPPARPPPPREVVGIRRTIAKRPLLGKFATRASVTLRSSREDAQQQVPWVQGGVGVTRKGSVKGSSKGKGKGKVKGKGKGKLKGFRKGPKEQPPRRRIGGRLEGKILRWKRTFGWIEPTVAVQHSLAAKHEGNVFLHQIDVLGGKTPREGDSVDFLPYTDRSGLGGEKCRILLRADGNDEGEEIEALDELEEAEATAAADRPEEEEDEVQAVEELDEPQDVEEPEDAEKLQGEGEEENAEEVEDVVEDTAKSKAPPQDRAKDKGKSAGKGKANEASSGKGGAVSAAAAPGVKSFFVKRPLASSQTKAGDAAGPAKSKPQVVVPPKAGKGSTAGKGKASAKMMESKPKASAGGNKAPTIGGKAGKGSAAKGGGRGGAATPPATPPTPAQRSGGLPPNWEEHWSEEHTVPYYWNKVTKESKWLRPTA